MSLPFKRSIPFVEHLGVTLEAFGDGKARLQFSPWTGMPTPWA